MEFLTFSASKEESKRVVVPKVGSVEASAGYDPYRVSQLYVEDYVAQGYDKETTDAYLDSIKEGLQSPNLVVDIRFPEATKVMSILDTAIVNHLNTTKGKAVTDQMRRSVMNDVTAGWTKTIADFDARGDTNDMILPQYQKLRGVYGELNEDKNHIGDVRWVGYTLAFIIIVMALIFSGWVAVNRKHRVVKISQPIFLHLICFGVLVLSCAIFPLGIDDSNAPERGQDAACMSIPVSIYLSILINHHCRFIAKAYTLFSLLLFCSVACFAWLLSHIQCIVQQALENQPRVCCSFNNEEGKNHRKGCPEAFCSTHDLELCHSFILDVGGSNAL